MERIAGEKLRAFLSSLPEYRDKFNRPGKDVRAKDLYDLALILRHRPVSNEAFWRTAADEFRHACHSRKVDCEGLSTFRQNWRTTRQIYETSSLPDDVSFVDAETALTEIVDQLRKFGVLPIRADPACQIF